MSVYTATFSAVAVSAAQDVFEIVAPAGSRIATLGVTLGQYSDFGDAAAEIVGVTFVRGDTVSGSGGTTATPANTSGLTGGKASAVTSVETNNTTVANTGGTVLLATAWNVQVPFEYRAGIYQDEIIKLEIGQRFCVRLTAPADAITLNGTLMFEELGQ